MTGARWSDSDESPMTETVPFTPLEEAIFYIERMHGPWNVQFEVETTARIDADRLRAAVIAACNAHPLARARKRPHDETDRRCHWAIPDAIADLPPETVTVVDDLTASETSAFYRERFDPPEELPFRVLVGRGEGRDDGDRVLICSNHVAADGVGGAQFVRSLCRAYRGEAPDVEPVALGTARAAVGDAGPTSPRTTLELLSDALCSLGTTLREPARIAGNGGVEAEGWLFERRRLDAALTERVLGERSERATVNDAMLAALHRCIEAWNRDHGEPAGRISVMMPLNLRPREWFYDVVGMFTAIASISTRRRDRRDPGTTLRTVVEQTRRIKDRDRATIPHEVAKRVPSGTPVGLKEWVPELLNGLGRRFVDTAVLSNLGRIPAPRPGFTPDDDPTLWFSPPSFTLAPVGIGVATVGGAIHVTGRYWRRTFDADAAAAFTDRYLDCLEAVVG
ncbi:hypothetical protein [Halorientalis pallida]|uniref:Condensation domain-containing protein n=1 Tax=Halorientalis pallida TaxID=2479928 RepID=A0A498L011_9EURY|nr:hypothetical protein [Halorientalis pallida]RXK49063.1 hypothetical protein EAF64_09030 [Halorientalis pallida]